ncbi:MAG: ABC-F family ATP-binding cassette domain-containing protein [Chloroflexi bacterium]|nr:ABC-F family ATP-binding cassette domain-containing protein [Chloroflexota bacterium]
MLTIDSISKELGGRVVLRAVSFTVPPGQAAGVVGANGAGKSTLLRIIAGELAADSGRIQLPRGGPIGYLPQGYSGREGETVAEAFPGVFGGEGSSEELERLGHELALDPYNPALVAAYDRVLARLAAGPAEAAIEPLREALGLRDISREAHLGELSGGELTRLGLLSVAASQPPLLLLDEPTNHLDLAGIEWVQAFVRRFRGPAVVVSHDRALLDACAQQIVEVDGATGTAESFAGNYSAYAEEKARRAADQLERYRRQQREERHLKEVISAVESRSRSIENKSIDFYVRKRAKKVARRAVTLKARVERQLESAEHVTRPGRALQGFAGSFHVEEQGAALLVSVMNVALAAGGRRLVEGLSFDVRRGQTTVITGPNGAGKTTLLRAILGAHDVSEGRIAFSASATPGYLAQSEPASAVGQEAAMTPVELLRRKRPMTDGEASNVLHRFLLGHTQVRTPVRELSYGERRRLALALMVLGGANLLVLDEPTNHLDLPSQEAFETALAGYDGAVIAVTHDRYFIEQFADEVVDLGAFAAV